MEVHSLGCQTDLFFPQFDGEVIDRDFYKVIRTPSNPDFYWGNYILFRDAPVSGDREAWEHVFDVEIKSRLPVRHYAFCWDSAAGDTGRSQEFTANGYSLLRGIVLAAEVVNPPPKANDEVEVRPLHAEWEWRQALQNQVDCRGDGFTLEEYLPFKREQMARYHRMSDAGLGHWFGAFCEGKLVADLGIFVRDGMARFQSVGTNPAYRRLGICGTLVYQASQYAFANMNVGTLVMVADEDYFAAAIYESVGFRPRERQVNLEKRPGA